MSVRVFSSLDNTVKSILRVFEFLYSYSSKVYILKSAVVFFVSLTRCRVLSETGGLHRETPSSRYCVIIYLGLILMVQIT